MSTRLTPVSVADREIKRWREREAKLEAELQDVRQRIDQWATIRDELDGQAHVNGDEPGEAS